MHFFLFILIVIFICGFSPKVTWEILVLSNNRGIHRNKHFSTQTKKTYFHIFKSQIKVSRVPFYIGIAFGHYKRFPFKTHFHSFDFMLLIFNLLLSICFERGVLQNIIFLCKLNCYSSYRLLKGSVREK